MTSIQARTVRRGLTSKGFDEVNRGDIFYHFVVNGKKSGIHTMMSHGETYCGTKYLTTMARQLGLKRDELVQLVECPLSRDEYEKLLRGRGRLSSRPIVGCASSRSCCRNNRTLWSSLVAALRSISAHVPLVWPVHPRTRARLDGVLDPGGGEAAGPAVPHAAHHHGAAGHRCRRHEPAHRSLRRGGDYGRRAG